VYIFRHIDTLWKVQLKIFVIRSLLSQVSATSLCFTTEGPCGQGPWLTQLNNRILLVWWQSSFGDTESLPKRLPVGGAAQKPSSVSFSKLHKGLVANCLHLLLQ
jgi:hypothetical protein